MFLLKIAGSSVLVSRFHPRIVTLTTEIVVSVVLHNITHRGLAQMEERVVRDA